MRCRSGFSIRHAGYLLHLSHATFLASQPGTGFSSHCVVVASMKPKTDFSKIGDILSENFSSLSLVMKVKNSNRRIG